MGGSVEDIDFSKASAQFWAVWVVLNLRRVAFAGLDSMGRYRKVWTVQFRASSGFYESADRLPTECLGHKAAVISVEGGMWLAGSQ
jgi:hypothetical protein